MRRRRGDRTRQIRGGGQSGARAFAQRQRSGGRLVRRLRGSFIGIQTATAIVERLSELPEAGEASADIVGLENETCVKQKSGDAYSYASVIVRDTDKIAVGKSAEAPAMNSISVGVQAICSGINGISIGRKIGGDDHGGACDRFGGHGKTDQFDRRWQGALAEGDAAVAVGKVGARHGGEFHRARSGRDSRYSKYDLSGGTIRSPL